MNRPEVGLRVKFRHRVDRFPEFSAPAETTGTVVEVTDAIVVVKADQPITGAEQWDNCVHFYDGTSYGKGHPADGWDGFFNTVEVLRSEATA
jgi:hypothetical protein